MKALTYQEEKEPLASVREHDIHVDIISDRSHNMDDRRASISSITSTQSTPVKSTRMDNTSYRSPPVCAMSIPPRPRFNSVGSASISRASPSPSRDINEIEKIASD